MIPLIYIHESRIVNIKAVNFPDPLNYMVTNSNTPHVHSEDPSLTQLPIMATQPKNTPLNAHSPLNVFD